MTSVTAKSRFLEYTQTLVDACMQHSSIVGLVLVGSTAETSRVDEWSDHDFFVITESGDQEQLRTNLSWLPDAATIAFSFRETEHGLKVVYKSGAVLEFAIFDCTELRGCQVNHHRLVFGGKTVEAALTVAVNNYSHQVRLDALSEFQLFLSLILIGVGRARRGEILAAGQHIRTHAATALMRSLTRFLPIGNQLDTLDVWRRFEFTQPQLSKELADALSQGPEIAALHLLKIAEKVLPPIWSEYPLENVRVIQRALAWID
jgi:hypothetical protein